MKWTKTAPMVPSRWYWVRDLTIHHACTVSFRPGPDIAWVRSCEPPGVLACNTPGDGWWYIGTTGADRAEVGGWAGPIPEPTAPAGEEGGA